MRKFKLLKSLGLTFINMWKTLDCWYIFLLYAGILTLVSCLFRKWSYSCITAETRDWCFVYPNNITGVYAYLITYYICVCFVFFSFGYDLYNTAFNRVKFKLQNVFKLSKERLKCVCFCFINTILWISPVMLAFYIITRPAIPDFAAEFGLFLIVFSCLVFSLLYVRVSSFIGYYFNDLRMPSLIKIFKATSGRAYVPIVLFLVLLLIICVIQLRTIGSLTKLNAENTFTMTILTEYVDYCLKLFLFGLFLANFKSQADLLQQEESPATNEEISALEQKSIKNKTKDEKSKTDPKKIKKALKKSGSKATKKSVAKKTAKPKKKNGQN